MICDALEHLNRYRGLHRNLDTAIDYLTAYHVARDLYDLPLGRTEVDGENVFINVMEADLSPDSTRLEYHKKYADLQIDLTGGEGRFVLFFPGELHKPGVARPGCAHVRKAVIKIRMED